MFDPKTQTPVGNVWQDETTKKWFKTVRVDDQNVASVPYNPDDTEPEETHGKKTNKAKL